jgi:hypothetical protein
VVVQMNMSRRQHLGVGQMLNLSQAFAEVRPMVVNKPWLAWQR